MVTLADPLDLAGLALPNRVVMAPMTRLRAPDQVADELIAEYYAQRSSAGLIVSEGVPVSAAARGHAAVPGIHRPRQVAGWRGVTEAVHAAGGRIVAQLWHVGRLSHPALQPGGAAPAGPTDAPAAEGRSFLFDDDGVGAFVPVTASPRALDAAGIARVIADFAAAAGNAVDAGFDGVEIHGANGYLLHQFINAAVNDRDDEWGGEPMANRLRLPLAIVDAVIEAVAAKGLGPGRVGFRASPYGTAHDMPLYPGIEITYRTLAAELTARRVGFLHLADQSTTRSTPTMAIPGDVLAMVREEFPGPLILTGGMDRARAEAALDSGVADLIGFGRPFIANPDLPRRLLEDLPLAEVHQDTVYAQGPEGYVDYPAYGD